VTLDVGEVYYLESAGHDTLVRTARKTRLRSVRSLGELEKALKSGGFLRVYKSFVVNLDRVRHSNDLNAASSGTIEDQVSAARI
jgi:DNA-binding LytR/AlgR family response regulator